MKKESVTLTKEKRLIRKCHKCGHVHETNRELERCPKCRKAFLPHQYFLKIHSKSTQKTTQDYSTLFSHADELCEDDLVKGLNVLW